MIRTAPTVARPAHPARTRLVRAGLVAVGVALALTAFALARGREDERATVRFAQDAAKRAGGLEKGISSLGEVLHATRAFYDSSVRVTREEFGTFVHASLERMPCVRAVAWVPIIDDDGRMRHRQSVVAEGGPADYEIVNRQGGVVPRGRVVFPVTYLEPSGPQVLRLGEDLGSVPTFAATMAHASATRDPVMSDPVRMEGPLEHPLVLMFLAVRARADDPANDSVGGFVALAFSPRDLLPAAPAGMSLTLDDPDVSGGMDRLAGVIELRRDATTVEQRVRGAGQTWLLAATAHPGYIADHRTFWPWVLAAKAALLWLFVICGTLVVMRRGREDALRRHDRAMQSVLSSLQEGVIVSDADGNLVFSNEAAERILGRSTELGASGTWSSSFGCFLSDTQTPIPEHRMPLFRALHGQETPEREIFLRNPGIPEGRWVTVSGIPLRTEGGAVRGAMMVLRDVSAKKRSQQAIRRLSRAVNHTADAVYIADARGEIVYVSKAVERMTGYSRGEAAGGSFQDVGLGGGDPEHFVQLRAAIVEERGFRGTTANMHKAGRTWFGEQTLTPMRDAKGHLTNWVGVCRDMTERMRIEEQRIEMDLASSVQKKLYPLRAPRMPGFDVAGAVFSADATCGDYFDFIELDENRVAIVIGDVSGHGLGPAFVMSQVRACLRSYLEMTDDLSEVFGRVNRVLVKDFDGDFFVTLMVIVMDLDARTMQYCNAAHIPAYILDEKGEAKATLKRTGLPLGLFEESEYEVGEDVTLEIGDVAVLLTDGVVEARSPDGECLWEDGAVAVVQRHVEQSAADIVERLYERVRSHSRGRAQDDDVTMVILKSVDPSCAYVRPSPKKRLKTGKQGTIAMRAH